MTTGELQSLISYSLQILMSLMMISMIVVMLTMAKASVDRILEVLKEQPDIQNPDNPKKEVKDGSIVFENVNFSYAKDINKLSLKDVNITINSGETIGIIGGTGSGKSTLVQLIPRLYDVTTGSLKVGGEDVRNYDLKVLRDSVAMVLQKNVLFSGTIKENLRWGNENASDEEIIHACKLAQAEEFIETFPDKYDTYIEQGGTNVSGGQRQRLCIARALIKKPKVLILDDSTSAVDTRTDSLIRNSFKEYIPEVTKIIIAQRIASVEEADKVIVLDDGEVVDFGTPRELMKTSKIYKEVYDSQVKGGIVNE
jgi:ATP-binding cassette subfamily B protein